MQVYFIQDDRIRSSTAIRSAFPSGPNTVDAAVYDNERELLVLINGRNYNECFLCKNKSHNLFVEQMLYSFQGVRLQATQKHGFQVGLVLPKGVEKLPSALFPPSAAVRWHDKHQMLLSNGGKFALYDEYWNKSLMTGRTTDYFKGFPHNVRGISSWKNGKARIYTKNLVFIYDISLSTTIADGVPIPRFLKCQ
ncbi:hypothetical protein DICVIV_00397 [Dictyocaulus viviparus]|uniref:Hemopexin n=1 Tax=Dictyocaulus viviparus TaxID=29172 RepID=A0A0D8YBP2_DICVI|nr:hypothetical protein DICVIV_00397 [Dictyocaulus viviparus]